MMVSSRPNVRALLVWAFVVLLSAAASAQLISAQSTPDASLVATPVASPAASPVAGDLDAFLQTPVGQQFAWVLAGLNGEGEELTPEVYEAKFHPSFVQAVPYDQFMEIFAQLAAAGPWTPTDVADGATDLAAIVTIQGTGASYDLQIVVDDSPEHQIIGLLLQPGTPRSWNEVDAGISGFGSTVGLLAAELSGTMCTPVHELNADVPIAIGSVFKLYILGELGRQIAAGERSWDDQIAIEDAYRSMPSGDLHFAPAGSVYTLRYLADVMISQSDNTATDHLLYTLGRENVEAMVATMGHADSSLMIPMLSTRELFAIKTMLPPDRQEAYVNATPDERRAMLDGEIKAAADAMTIADGAGFVNPHLDRLGGVVRQPRRHVRRDGVPGRSVEPARTSTVAGGAPAQSRWSNRPHRLANCRLQGRIRTWRAGPHLAPAAGRWPMVRRLGGRERHSKYD